MLARPLLDGNVWLENREYTVSDIEKLAAKFKDIRPRSGDVRYTLTALPALESTQHLLILPDEFTVELTTQSGHPSVLRLMSHTGAASAC